MSCTTRNSRNKLEHMTDKPHFRVLQVSLLKFDITVTSLDFKRICFHRSAVNKSQTINLCYTHNVINQIASLMVS